METKQILKSSNKKFDLKFFLVGNSGSGKTHFCGTYTKGPIHFYMLDRGGEKSLYKLIDKRDKSLPPITIDVISNRTNKYSDFWKILQNDAKDGFFDHMAEQNGLVVLPDSLTTANIMAKKEIASIAEVDLLEIGVERNMRKVMSPPLWGQLLGWMQELIGTTQELPCATATTVHLFTEFDKDGAILKRVPAVNGQFRQLVGINFDEIYLLEVKGAKYNLYFKDHSYFEAKSRVFTGKKLTSPTMDIIHDAYLSGDPLNQKGGDTKTTTVFAKKH